MPRLRGGAPGPRRPPRHPAPVRPHAPRWPLTVGLAATLAGLLWHAWLYRFLTDDAFISFRYARNLAHGFGLVFNPGLERVEGYTNFLWVVLLAGLNRLGVAPEAAAGPLGVLFTVALWAMVAHFSLRRVAEPNHAWPALVPLALLALTRSVAVWSSSGLETRCFEFLVIAGVLRLLVELEGLERGAPRPPLAWLLFALAALTRPDGLLISGAVLAAGAAYVARRAPAELGRFVSRQIPFALVVGAHALFRRAYYGDWLPNTYYAKFDGHPWWASGWRYLAAFTLEYFAWLWIPLLALGVARHLRRNTPAFPLLVAAAIVPHVLYVAAIGGDHFEYRPLDLYFPLLYLLMADGVAVWASSRARTLAAAAYLLLVGAGLTLIPWESHRQFIRRYSSAFPGGALTNTIEAREFLAPDRSPVLRQPGLSALATAHRDLLRWMTARFVAVRQEEHRMFLAKAIEEGRELRRLRDQGVIPEDTYIAVDCVGAIPYFSDLRTLDRLGLTDAHVAHSAAVRTMMAHAKSATLDYARQRGVDLWAVDPVHLTLPVADTRSLYHILDAATQHAPEFVIDAGENVYLLCQLPRGIAATRARLGKTHIVSVVDTSFVGPYLRRCVAAYRDTLASDPGNLRAARDLGSVFSMQEDWVSARRLYLVLVRVAPSLGEGFEGLSLADQELGLDDEAMWAGRQAAAMARARGDEAALKRIANRLPRAIAP